ncbi:iron complex transport system permease protein (plasmid) [Ketogulonicigenium robustum]|uniref:Iron complex transport system permease protein n=1 Tax=Ketogulonicigenium robustum TaxID=92947 RepID=A0A1W6P3U5_9RHOB|nr:iron ABC transporter permease [Ketogulonicigenium robustum]ARO16007.1 iron complex transport system permease protein [Ketogulonicigenium robustum]
MTLIRPSEILIRTPRLSLLLPRRALWMCLLLTLIAAATLLASLGTGSFGATWHQTISALRGGTGEMIDNVVWEFRLPRAICALLAGAMMALSGAALQNLTRNSLADPSLVGVSQGAACAALIVLVAAPTAAAVWRPLAAFGGALAVTALILALSASKRGNTTVRFILLGIGVAAMISAINAALMTYGNIDRVVAALGWLSGSIGSTGWRDVHALGFATALLAPALLALARPIGALRLGEATATGLGVNTRKLRPLLVIIAVGLAATATASVGPLGFIGLICPHAARRLAPAGPALHLVLTALCGAVLVALADLAGRTLAAPVQIPAGLITAMIGVPVFVGLLRRGPTQG